MTDFKAFPARDAKALVVNEDVLLVFEVDGGEITIGWPSAKIPGLIAILATAAETASLRGKDKEATLSFLTADTCEIVSLPVDPSAIYLRFGIGKLGMGMRLERRVAAEVHTAICHAMKQAPRSPSDTTLN